MRKRHRKKLHRTELDRVQDLSLESFWRRRLYDSQPYRAFLLDRDHLEGIPPCIANVIRAGNLRYDVSKVDAREAPAWMSSGGLIIFRFRSVEFPSVVAFSGNNPDYV